MLLLFVLLSFSSLLLLYMLLLFVLLSFSSLMLLYMLLLFVLLSFSTLLLLYMLLLFWERDVAQSIACPPLKRSVVGSILLSGPSCSLGYFPFQPVVHNWFIKGRGMYCSVYGKVHIKDPLLLIEKSSLCGGSGFPSKKCVNVTI